MIQESACSYPSLSKEYNISNVKEAVGITESFCLPKINAKMTTRTKNAEMSKIVSNSEIHLHHCLCESRGFKIGKSKHRRCSVKKVFLKILEN